MTWLDTRRNRFLQGAIAVVILVMAVASPHAHEAKSADELTVHHIVICWLKESGSDTARQELIDAAHGLADIPGVLNVRAGTALPSDRPIVDSSFDVAIIFTFPDRQAMNAYLKHPIHQETLKETIRPLVQKILVYDFVTGI